MKVIDIIHKIEMLVYIINRLQTKPTTSGIAMGLTYNETKYVFLRNPHRFKSFSLEDNIYFTLRDVFANTFICSDKNIINIDEGIALINQLTNDICYEDRTEGFKYSNVLSDKAFVSSLLTWLDTIEPDRDFDFSDEVNEFEEENEVIVKEDHCITIDETKFQGYVFDYIALDAWWEHLHDLKETLNKLLD